MGSIDLSSITSQSITQYAETTAAAKKADDIKKTINSTSEESTNEELMDACKAFESYFLEQIFKEMMNTVEVFKSEDSSDNGLTTLVDYFKGETIADIAETSTETNGLGLAQMLYENMKRNYDL